MRDDDHGADDRVGDLLEALPCAVREIDRRGLITATSAAHDRLLGRPRGWFLGQHVADAIPEPEARRAHCAHIDRLLTHPSEPQPLVLALLHGAGHVLRVRVDWRYRRDAAGQVRGIVSTLTDLSQAEVGDGSQAVAQRMARIGDWRFEPRSRRLAWSAEASALFGLPLDHTEGSLESLLAAVHPDDRPLKLRALDGLLRDGGHYCLTYRVAAASGPPRLVEERAEALRDGAGAIRLVRGVVKDVTVLHQAVEEARDNAARLDQALRLGRMGVWDWDTGGGGMWWSREARVLLGLPADAVATADAFLALVHPDDRAAVDMLVCSLAPAGGPATFEFRLRRPDGTERILRAEAECLRQDPTGRVVRGVCRDVTEERHQDAALREAVRQATEAVREGAALLGGLARDLRPPLAALADQAESLADAVVGGARPVVAREQAAAIHATSRRLLDVLDDALDLSRLESGVLTLRDDRVKVGDLVAAAYQALCDRLPATEALRLVIDPPDGLPALRGDARRLGRVLVLLMERALEAAPRPATVRLGMLRRGADGVEIALRRDTPAAGAAIAPGWTPPARRQGARDLMEGVVALHGGRVEVPDGAPDGLLGRLILRVEAPRPGPPSEIVALRPRVVGGL